MGAGAGAGAGGAGAGATVVPPVVVVVVAVAPGLYVPVSKALLCGHSQALCPSCLQMKQLNVPFLLKRGMPPWRLYPGRPAPPVVANAIATVSPAYGAGARAAGWCRAARSLARSSHLGYRSTSSACLGVLKPCLVFVVGIGQTVDEVHRLEGIDAEVVERLRFVALWFFVTVVAHHPPGTFVVQVQPEAFDV